MNPGEEILNRILTLKAIDIVLKYWDMSEEKHHTQFIIEVKKTKETLRRCL